MTDIDPVQSFNSNKAFIIFHPRAHLADLHWCYVGLVTMADVSGSLLNFLTQVNMQAGGEAYDDDEEACHARMKRLGPFPWTATVASRMR